MNRKERRANKKRNAIKASAKTDVNQMFAQAVEHTKNDNLKQAESIYQQLITLGLSHPDIYNNLGGIYKMQNRLQDAESAFRNAAILKPDYAQVHNNLGIVLYELGREVESLEAYENAIRADPDIADTYFNMANVFSRIGQYDKAEASYKLALIKNTRHLGAAHNLANMLRDLKRINEAVLLYENTIDIDPDFSEGYFALGNISAENGLIEKSIVYYEKALEKNQNFESAAVHLLHEYTKACEWDKFSALYNKVSSLTKESLEKCSYPSQMPFAHLCISDDAAENLKIATSWSSKIDSHNEMFVRRNKSVKKDEKKILTIGYISNRFSDTATAHNLLSIFRLHNRDNFKIICYSHGDDDRSFYRKSIEKTCDKFTDICSMSDVAAAQQIYDDNVDILVELKGHTQGNRLGISALKPAPVQVNFLGHPGTTGASWIDYIITDKIVLPEEHKKFYSEKIAYMPDTYWPTDNKQKISDKLFTKKELGLPEDSFVLCSFNNNFKIDHTIFSIWINLLKQTPKSVLWLYKSNDLAEKNIKKEAVKAGIDESRIIFAPHIPKKEHLARMKLADLAIDTRIYGGHTTTSDALWVGVPVITLLGNHFASRVSSSIISAINLSELIAKDLKHYEELILKYSSNKTELIKLKEKLARNIATTPLFDTEKFVKNLENLYMTISQ